MSDPDDKFSGLRLPSGSEKRMADALKEITGISKSMRAAMTGISPEMQKVAKQIAEQQNAIKNFRPYLMPDITRPPAIPPIDFPRNPIHETNERLASIQERFDRMEAIALNAAEIATSLQSSAAVFLQEFKTVAKDNDRTTKRAVRIGLAAILIAIATPIAQIVYTELYRGPADAESAQQSLTAMKAEISALQQNQEKALNKLTETLSRNGQEMTRSLVEIRDSLARPIDTPSTGKP